VWRHESAPRPRSRFAAQPALRLGGKRRAPGPRNSHAGRAAYAAPLNALVYRRFVYRRAVGDGSCGRTYPLRGRVLAWRPSLRFGLAVNDGAPGPHEIRTAGLGGLRRSAANTLVYRRLRLPPSRRRWLVWRHESAPRPRSRLAAQPAAFGLAVNDGAPGPHAFAPPAGRLTPLR
jgi:hypothetical protein